MGVEVERRGDVDVMWLDRPPVNALDLELLTAIVDTLAELVAGSDRPAVITGRGSAFCAGADLNRVLDDGPDYVAAFVPGLTDAFAALFRFPRPLVAAVNGHAIAGGAIVACCADHRVAVETGARIGVSELAVGVPFPLTALEVVRHALSPQRFQSAVTMAATYPPPRALDLGFVDELAPADEVLDRALAVAEQLGAIPTPSFGLTKAAMRKPIVERLAADAAAHDARVVPVWQSAEVQAAIRAFMDRTVRRG